MSPDVSCAILAAVPFSVAGKDRYSLFIGRGTLIACSAFQRIKIIDMFRLSGQLLFGCRIRSALGLAETRGRASGWRLRPRSS